MRNLTIIRKKKFSAYAISPWVVIDGTKENRIKNGQTVSVQINEDNHRVFVESGNNYSSLVEIIPGEEDVLLYLDFVFGGFTLTFNEYKTAQDLKQSGEIVFGSPKKQTASYVCGIISSIILFIISSAIYLGGSASFIGFILATVFSITSGVAIIMGGFWFIVIPLPYIAIWKAGCLKPYQPTSRKVMLGIAAFVSVALVFVMLFAIS